MHERGDYNTSSLFSAELGLCFNFYLKSFVIETLFLGNPVIITAGISAAPHKRFSVFFF